MVRTRSSARGFLFDRLSQERQYQLQELSTQAGFSQHSSQSSQHSQQSTSSQQSAQNNGYEYNYDNHDDEPASHYQASNDNNRPTYREGDECKRHRQSDNSPYEVDVVSYRRRKPVK